jgi:endonuclease/exonuclease/phosphatase (EEP) superfamily protein YafD
MLAALLAIVGLASFLGSWWGPLDLLSHFRPQWAAASLVAVLVALHTASRAGAVLSLCLLAAHTLPLAPYLAGIGSARSVAQTEVRVMTFNLRNRHTSADSFRALVEAEDPDIVLLTELPQDETPLLQALGDRYPQRTASRRGSPFDVVLLSRWTVETWSADRSVTTFLPVLTARLCDPSSSTRCLTVVGLHAARPFGSGANGQKAQLSLVVDAVKAVPTGRVVVLGDLNLTPWSATFQRFVREAGLSDNPRERGLVATWLSRFPLFGLALDHVLAGHGVEIVQSRVGRDVGSDHFAVTAHLALRPDP